MPAPTAFGSLPAAPCARSTATWTTTAGSCSPAISMAPTVPPHDRARPRARARTIAAPPPSAAPRSPLCASGWRRSRPAWRGCRRRSPRSTRCWPTAAPFAPIRRGPPTSRGSAPKRRRRSPARRRSGCGSAASWRPRCPDRLRRLLTLAPRLDRRPEHPLRIGPEGRPRGVAGVEHVAAGIDGELRALAEAGRELAQEKLACEVRRHEVGEAVHDERLEVAVERQRLAQGRNRFRLAAPAAPAPIAVHGAAGELVAVVRHLPVQGLPEMGDDRARQRRRHRGEAGVLVV